MNDFLIMFRSNRISLLQIAPFPTLPLVCLLTLRDHRCSSRI